MLAKRRTKRGVTYIDRRKIIEAMEACEKYNNECYNQHKEHDNKIDQELKDNLQYEIQVNRSIKRNNKIKEKEIKRKFRLLSKTMTVEELIKKIDDKYNKVITIEIMKECLK